MPGLSKCLEALIANSYLCSTILEYIRNLEAIHFQPKSINNVACALEWYLAFLEHLRYPQLSEFYYRDSEVKKWVRTVVIL
jgi:hypothetical protein